MKPWLWVVVLEIEKDLPLIELKYSLNLTAPRLGCPDSDDAELLR